MDLIRYSINKPVTVVAAVVLILLFGLISLNRLPYQLSPSVIEPEITVTTTWRGATPYEMEREIVEEQEAVLKSIPGLIEMESDSVNGRSTVTLRFMIGTGIDDALLRVSSKLNEVSSYPDGADNPVINATGASTSPTVWTALQTVEGNPKPIATYRSYFENDIRQYLERIDGVASLLVGSGTPEEVQIVVDPQRLVAYQITIPDLIRALAAENVNISAGNLGMGRRDYRIRTTAEFKSFADIAEVVIKSTGQRRILVRDVAQVQSGYRRKTGTVFLNGTEGIVVGFRPEHGTNILEMTERLKTAVTELNESRLNPKQLNLKWIADQTRYIRGAINIIKENIIIGGILAVVVLLLFVRSLRATVVVSTAIPISIIGTFIFMDLMGRNLNVVSLAGIAFAVGMLVDSAIVVIENIDRHRKMGKSGASAAYDGTQEVWGAILSSTLTTIAVFLPVVFLKGEAGQLFRDIAIAVVFAISLSLFVSVSVIPMFASKLYAKSPKTTSGSKNPIVWIGNLLAKFMMFGVKLATRNWFTRIATVMILVAMAGVLVKRLTPKMEYLPQGNRNFVMSMMVPPPGLSHQEREQIGQYLYREITPYMAEDHKGLPQIMRTFYVGAERFMFMGAMTKDWERAGELVPMFRKLVRSIPGMYGVAMQVGIFQTRLARGRTVDIDVSGASIDEIVKVAGMIFGKTRGAIPGVQVRPVPSIELMYPEVNIIPDRDRLRANGMTSSDLGVILDVFMDGRKIGEYKAEGEKKVDLILKAPDADVVAPEDLLTRMIATPKKKVLPISSLASIQRSTGLSRIRHLERSRTITLQVTPPKDIALQTAMERIDSEVLDPFRKKGLFKNVDVRTSGAAGKLTLARQAMQWNFVLAAVIAYLLMASLFGNFIYPMVIMLTVPLAGAGGFVGLWLLNRFITPQPLDIFTMLGFVILVGVVVNNAILIVHQSLNNIRYRKMDYHEAVLASTRSRLRPIYMSAATSIFGMLPLVIFPGAGTELYKGLGSVMLGGLAVSTIFTVFVIPSILLFVIRFEKPVGKKPVEMPEAHGSA